MFFSRGLTHKYLFTAAGGRKKKNTEMGPCELASRYPDEQVAFLQHGNTSLIEGFWGRIDGTKSWLFWGSFGMCWKKMVGLGLS